MKHVIGAQFTHNTRNLKFFTHNRIFINLLLRRYSSYIPTIIVLF